MIGFSYEYLSNDALCTVFINNNRAGSAFLFLHNERMYALTAYHCVFDDNTDLFHDDYAFGYENEKPFDVEVIYPQLDDDEQKNHAKSTDTALVSIKSGECYSRSIIDLHSRIKIRSNNDYSIIGYPCALSRKHLIELGVELIHKESLYINEFALLKKEDISVIKGFSGGIVCEKIDDKYYLCGLVSRALSEEFEYDYIKCASLESINQMLSVIDYNLLEIPECCYKRKSQSYQYLKEVLSRKEFSNYWVDGNASTEIEATIKEFLDKNRGNYNICTFIGLSGIGKTRSVLNACKTLREEATIYYDNIEKFRIDANCKWMDDENIVVIIDELKDCEWEEVYNCYAMNKCKIILIATIQRKTITTYSKSSAGFYTINGASDDDMIKIIRAQHGTFLDEEIKQICLLSYRDLRLALLISELYDHDKKEMNLESFSSMSLVANYSTAEKILEKTLSSFGEEKASLSRIYQELSTLIDVGYSGTAKEEFEFLAKFFNNSIDNYEYGIRTFSENNLGTKNGYYFKSMPVALSKLAFEKSIWPTLRYKITEFVSQLPNSKARRRFYERLYECEIEKEEVNGAFAPYFQERFGNETILEVFLTKPEEISLYIEFNPEKGLSWIENSLVKIKDITKFKYNRRYVVHLCERLACFKEHFDKCEKILYMLAQNETDHIYSNNSQSVWSDLFGIIGANSDLPFNTRINILFKRLCESNNTTSANPKLFNQAFSRVFANNVFRSVPPKVIGNRLTPSSWNPNTTDEWINCEQSTLNRLLDISESLSKEFRSLLLKTVLDYIYDFIKVGLVKNTFDLINVLINGNENKIQVIAKIQWLLEIDDLKNTQIDQFLESKLCDYQDKTILGRLYEYLHKEIWSYHKGSDYYKTLAVELAKELYSSGEPVEKYMPYFMDRDCKNSALEALSNALSKCDINNQLIDFALNEGDEYLPFIKGYISALAENTNNTNEIQYILDQCSEINIDFAFNNTVIFDVSKKGYERIGKIGGKVRNVQSNLGYYIVRWFNLIGDDIGTDLLTTAANSSPSMKYYLIFSCGQHLSTSYKSINKQISTEVYSYFIDQVKLCYLEKGRYQAFDMVHTFEYIPEELELEVFTSIIQFFDFNEHYDNINYELVQLLKSKINCSNNIFLMDLFGQKLLETKNHYKDRAFTGLFDLFMVETVLNWIDENPVERAPLLAYHLSYPTLDTPKCSKLTLRVLEKYANLPDTLKEFEKGTYNLKVENVSEVHDNKEKYISLYQIYKKYDNPISEWAQWKIDYINYTCDSLDERDIMDQRLNDSE